MAGAQSHALTSAHVHPHSHLPSPGDDDAGDAFEEGGGGASVAPTTSGRVASYYYLQHTTMAVFSCSLRAGMDLNDVMLVRWE